MMVPKVKSSAAEMTSVENRAKEEHFSYSLPSSFSSCLLISK